MEPSFCGASASACCAYYDPAAEPTNKLTPVPVDDARDCAALLFRNDVWGFVYPTVEYVFERALPPPVQAAASPA